MAHIGNLGHSALLVPAALVIIGLLLWIGRRADALALGAALAAVLLATLAAKLTIYTCEPRTPWLGVESPSGHVSFAAAFYGCLALLAAAGRPLWQRIVLYAATILFVALIGASRIAIEVHTLSDVIVGAVIGALSVLLFQVLRGPPRPIVVPLRVMALGLPVSAALALTILVYARHWTPEGFIEHVGLRLDHALGVCASL
jgi:membrane-associated phospholipid phosphatase